MFRRLTLRLKLIALAASALVLVAGGLTTMFDRMMLRALGAQLQSQALAAKPILQAALTGAVAERDFATLEAVLRESVESGSFAHLVLLDPRGEPVLSVGWAAIDGPPHADVPRMRMRSGEERLLGRVPLELAGQPLGAVLFGLSCEPVESAHRQLLMLGLAAALISLVLAVPLVEIGSRLLFRPLRRLERAVDALRDGSYEEAIAIRAELPDREAGRPRDADISRLTAAFLDMAETLEGRLRALAASEATQRALVEQAMLREVQLREAKDRAEAGTRAKGQFLANMSHEVRTPLNGIIGMAQVLRDSDLTPADREAVEVIVDSGRLLLALINDILDFSRLEEGGLELRPQPVETRALLALPLAPLAADAARRGLGWRVELAPGLPAQVVADRTRVAQVLLNLAGNALKFTERGEVAIAARWIAGAEGGRLRVEVRDSGVGIAPEAFPRLFERFTQVDASLRRRHGGAGLGLAISRQLVRLMGGEIGFESQLGQGSLFWFELPLPVPANAEAPPASLRVLVAEEIPAMRSATATFLRRLGHEVVAVGDAEAALAALREGRFDAVLLDMEMGEAGAEATLRRIRALPDPNGGVPVLAYSGSAAAEDQARFRRAGLAGVVPKPVRPLDLQAALLDAVAAKA